MTSSNVPSPRLRKSRSPCAGWPASAAAPGSSSDASLNAVDIEPSVAVEIDQAQTARHRLGQQVLRRLAIVENEAEADRLGIVDELGNRSRRIDVRYRDETAWAADVRGRARSAHELDRRAS